MTGLLHVIARGGASHRRPTAELSPDFDSISPDDGHCFTQDLLVPQQLLGDGVLRNVGLCRVEEGTTGCDRFMDKFEGILVGYGSAGERGNAHHAHAALRDFQSVRSAEVYASHDVTPFDPIGRFVIVPLLSLGEHLSWKN